MKQLVLTIGIGLAATFTFAQKTNVTNAALAYKDFMEDRADNDVEGATKNLLAAKGYIDEACNHADTKDTPKALMYKGKIYIDLSIMAAGTEGGIEGVDAEKAGEEGFEALKRSKKVDKKGRYEDDVDAYANQFRIGLSNMGIAAYGDKKYKEAMGALLGAAAFGEVIGTVDSTFYFYGGAAAFNEEEWDVAQEAFEKCVEIGYNVSSSAYYISQSYQKQGKTEEAEKTLKDITAKYPKDKDVMIELINLYIDTDRKEEAEKVLSAAIELDPNNTALLFTSGTIYENMGRFDDAKSAYEKTLAIQADNVDAQFALGGLYFNKGADVYNEANKLPFGDPSYDAMIEESKGYFKQALPYLEGAAEKEPNDVVILESLKAVYGKLSMMDKFKETKQRIADIKAGK